MIRMNFINHLLKSLAVVTLLLNFSLPTKGQPHIELSTGFFPDTVVLDSVYTGILFPATNTGDQTYSGGYAIYFRTNNVPEPKRIDTGVVDSFGPGQIDTFVTDTFQAASQTYGGGNDVVVIWPEINTGSFDSSEQDVYFYDSNATTALFKNQSEPQLDLYPNPAGDRLQWDLSNTRKSLDHVSILDKQGKVLQKSPPSANHVSLKPYSKGTYVIRLVFRDGTQVTRLVVKN